MRRYSPVCSVRSQNHNYRYVLQGARLIHAEAIGLWSYQSRPLIPHHDVPSSNAIHSHCGRPYERTCRQAKRRVKEEREKAAKLKELESLKKSF